MSYMLGDPTLMGKKLPLTSLLFLYRIMEPNFCFWETIPNSLYLNPHHTQLCGQKPYSRRYRLFSCLLLSRFNIITTSLRMLWTYQCIFKKWEKKVEWLELTLTVQKCTFLCEKKVNYINKYMWSTQNCIRLLVISHPGLPLLSFMVLNFFPYFNADGRDFLFKVCFFLLYFWLIFTFYIHCNQVLG